MPGALRSESRQWRFAVSFWQREMEINRRRVVDLVLLVVVNTMWAAQYAAYKTATEKMGPVTVSVWTFLISTVVLLPFLLRERRKRDAGSAARRLWTAEPRRVRDDRGA